MTAELTKYIGWPLEGISLDGELFTVSLARHALSAGEIASLSDQRVRAKMVFISDKVALSNVRRGAEIAAIEQRRDRQGHILCSDVFIGLVHRDYRERNRRASVLM